MKTLWSGTVAALMLVPAMARADRAERMERRAERMERQGERREKRGERRDERGGKVIQKTEGKDQRGGELRAGGDVKAGHPLQRSAEPRGRPRRRVGGPGVAQRR